MGSWLGLPVGGSWCVYLTCCDHRLMDTPKVGHSAEKDLAEVNNKQYVDGVGVEFGLWANHRHRGGE